MTKLSRDLTAAANKAVATRKKRLAIEQSRKTWAAAMRMTKWVIAQTPTKTKWQLVDFLGPKGFESRGIVDLIAMRKNHRTAIANAKRGDSFEIILIQVKGGDGGWPSIEDTCRLLAVSKAHQATQVVLSAWNKGTQPSLYRLSSDCSPDEAQAAVWIPTTSREVFG